MSRPPDLPASDHRSRKRSPVGGAGRSLLLLLLLGLAIHLLLPQVTALEHSLSVLRSLAWWALLLAIAAQCFSYISLGYVFRELVGLFGQPVRLLRCIAIAMASYSLSLIWGGQVTFSTSAFRWLRSAGVSREAALLTGIIPALVNVLTIGVVSAFGLLYLLAAHKLSPALATALAMQLILLLGLGFFLWWGMRHRPGLIAFLRRLDGLYAKVRRRPYDPAATDAAAERLFRAWDLLLPGGWRGPILADVMNVGFDFLTLYMLFFAAHYTPNPGLVLAGYGLPLLAGKLAILPGGLGIVEGGMVALYGALGVPAGVDVVVILGYRLLSFWIPVLIGFPLIPFLDRQTAAQVAM